MTWRDRWAKWDDKGLTSVINFTNEARFERYARTILFNLRPTNTLDIGGGTGGLGEFLPGKYTVMDHPRMQKFCKVDNFIPINPETEVGEITGEYDLVVSTNSLSETSIPTIQAYLDQIEALKIPYLYLNGRRQRHGLKFDDYPLQNWEPIVKRAWGGRGARFIEFLGKLK